jgi:hypothetical protein
MGNNRVILAFLIAPVSFGLLFLLFSLFAGKAAEGALIFQFVALVGYPIALLIGLPLFALFRYLRWNGLVTYALSAVGFSGLLIYLFVVGPSFREGQPIENVFLPARLAQMSIISFACITTVITFWLVARPDKD